MTAQVNGHAELGGAAGDGVEDVGGAVDGLRFAPRVPAVGVGGAFFGDGDAEGAGGAGHAAGVACGVEGDRVGPAGAVVGDGGALVGDGEAEARVDAGHLRRVPSDLLRLAQPAAADGSPATANGPAPTVTSAAATSTATADHHRARSCPSRLPGVRATIRAAALGHRSIRLAVVEDEFAEGAVGDGGAEVSGWAGHGSLGVLVDDADAGTPRLSVEQVGMTRDVK